METLKSRYYTLNSIETLMFTRELKKKIFSIETCLQGNLKNSIWTFLFSIGTYLKGN
jgi:hypothetical protein